MTSEKQVSFQATNTYSTRNVFSEKTKNVWFVFHGMGYLSRYFLKYFEALDPEFNYIIAPQAPSKYYMGKAFKHVGASWLTREQTVAETHNVLTYIDAVAQAEQEALAKAPRTLFLGYSQGVSVVTRWMAFRQVSCNELVLHSGGIPKELTAADFAFLSEKTNVTYLYGNKDQYITEARKTEEQLKGSQLFGSRLKVQVFEGIHEVHTPFLTSLE
ncbi:esterase [Altibacter sp.]|uniref:alpha/beta hydrolase n=1 Tax=Altibacter sp. TaxID=2024823 RepID=UPI000C982ED6|nr:esterase [Altibacter sp.]MAP53868.1 esterase [Altibacter sp.]